MNSCACASRAAASISPPRDARPAVGDVGGDGVAEEVGFLEDEGDLRAQARQRDVAHVDAVDEDAAVLRVVEAGDQVDERALARAGRADDRDDAAAGTRS
jgi:hypothetical protein